MIGVSMRVTPFTIVLGGRVVTMQMTCAFYLFIRAYRT